MLRNHPPRKKTQDQAMIGYMTKYRNRKVAKRRSHPNKIPTRNHKEKLQNLKKSLHSLFNHGKTKRSANHK